ncbi:hypothetical protein [Paractinoplanes ovalisporus]|uniref:hypothetical protein n=1 Tax=Paractinoplanes ovalisporus TaxID=2810368 RepID=UPI001F3BFE26|nr:hypothetical protein [Actinoplanes ovalisporus]
MLLLRGQHDQSPESVPAFTGDLWFGPPECGNKLIKCFGCQWDGAPHSQPELIGNSGDLREPFQQYSKLGVPIRSGPVQTAQQSGDNIRPEALAVRDPHQEEIAPTELDLFAGPPDQMGLSNPVPPVHNQSDRTAALTGDGRFVGPDDRGADIAVQAVDVKVEPGPDIVLGRRPVEPAQLVERTSLC